MQNNKLNKKASISSTLTWTVAIFIILFILFIFELFAFGMIGGGIAQKIFAPAHAIQKTQPSVSLISAEMLVALLDTNVQLDGGSVRLDELILKWADMGAGEKINGKYDNNQIRTLISKEAHSVLITLNSRFYFHIEKNPDLNSILANKDASWTGRDVDSKKHADNSIEANSPGFIKTLDEKKERQFALNQAASIIFFNKNHEPIEIRLFAE